VVDFLLGIFFVFLFLRGWARGFVKEATVHLYALNRTGVHRFHEYASQRYGEVELRAARRTRSRGPDPTGSGP